MERYGDSYFGPVQALLSNLLELGWPVLIVAQLSICIITRIFTGIQSHLDKADHDSQPRSIRMAPYWIPWLGHSLSFSWDHVSLIEKARDSMGESTFGIILGGIKYTVIVSPSMAKSVLSSGAASSTGLINYALKNIFGDQGRIQNLDSAGHQLLHHNIPNLFMREPFVTDGSKAICRLVEHETPNLVTFNQSPVDQSPWERESNVTVAEGLEKPACEADLFALLRNFSGHIATSTLMGEAILENFNNLLQDLWTMDSQFLTLSMGGPRWLSPGLSRAYAARDRLLEALATFHQAFVSWDNGIDPGVKFRDLDDVSEPIKQRVRMFRDLGLSPQTSAPGHLSLFWAMNGNSPKIVFWHILRLYSDPVLLEEIRREISSYVKAHRPSIAETGFPFQEAPRLSMDLDGLMRSCHLLRASLYETMRLDSAGISFRDLTSDLALSESSEDAALAGRPVPLKYQVKKGGSVVVPHGVLHNDARYFSNPGQFDPLRFILTDSDTGSRRADLHTIDPFGIGISTCKDRTFAEREILAFTAAIISMWDITPVDGKSFTIPGHKPSSAAYLPKKDIRVRLSTRV